MTCKDTLLADDGRITSSAAAAILAGMLAFLVLAVGSDTRAGEPDQIGELPVAHHPRHYIVVIYNHGSTQEFWRDACVPGHYDRPEGLPSAIRDLRARRIDGKRVLVFAYCTPSKTGNYHYRTRTGTPKVIERERDIEGLVTRLHAMGVRSSQIFLAGWSAGGWASLMVEADHPGDIDGVIAIAPAFAGPAMGRPAGWQALRDRLARRLVSAGYLPSLVFAFRGDRFETPSDLRFLDRIPGVTMLSKSGNVIGGVPCAVSNSHYALLSACFHTQTSRIAAFIESRLQNAGATAQR